MRCIETHKRGSERKRNVYNLVGALLRWCFSRLFYRINPGKLKIKTQLGAVFGSFYFPLALSETFKPCWISGANGSSIYVNVNDNMVLFRFKSHWIWLDVAIGMSVSHSHYDAILPLFTHTALMGSAASQRGKNIYLKAGKLARAKMNGVINLFSCSPKHFL